MGASPGIPSPHRCVDAPAAPSITLASGCHNPQVKIDKLTTTNAFVIIDLEDASQAAGVVRAAPKVLQGSSKALARTATYTFAVRELQVSGASAGISADPEERVDAIAAFVTEVAPRVESGELVLDPGGGVEPGDLAELAGKDRRDPVHAEMVDGVPLMLRLDAVGAAVAAETALGGLENKSAAVEIGPSAGPLVAELTARGAKVVAFGGSKGVAHDSAGLDTDALASGDDAVLDQLGGELQPAESLLTTDASVLFCGSRQGMIDGEAAESLGAGLVVPTGCQPVSAKGLAVLRRRDVVALADFVSTAGRTFAGWPAGESAPEAIIADASAGIAAIVRDTLSHDEGAFLGACHVAEAFLSTWQDPLPFGRPLA